MIRFLFFILFSTSIFAKLPTQPYGIYNSEYSQFWFLYQNEKKPGQSETIFRPFYSSYRDNLSAHRYQTSLYPFYYKEETNYWKKWTFLFVFTHDSTNHPDIGYDEDMIFTPMLQWGKGDTERERYFSFFPFYGQIRSKISWSEINYIIFPLYSSWQYKEFRARSILWPFIIFGSSDIRKEYRFFPFYSHKSHIAKFDHNVILWPFYQWGTDREDQKEPSSYRIVFPFFNYKSSLYGNMRSYGFLWLPLLGSFVGYGYDNRTQERDFNLFFFLYQYSYNNDKDYRKHVFYPFYGYSHFANKSFTFITPFYINMRSDTYGVRSDSFYLIPFFHYMKKEFVKEERKDTYWKFWPLFRWHEDSEGNLYWNSLSLFPIRSIQIERVWDPIWSIIEYQSFINNEKRLSLFFRLYTQRWNEDDFHLYIPFLLDLDLEKNRTRWSILYGFLGYERNEDKRSLNFLWFFKI